ncbi:hypothetical protein C8R44DRAFT_871559 [Mycena epipterygia]|nr:hypothetical protein C8R44DRAFT_871559 [Mycena epipterygia]
MGRRVVRRPNPVIPPDGIDTSTHTAKERRTATPSTQYLLHPAGPSFTTHGFWDMGILLYDPALLSTPTPSNRLPPASRAFPVHGQFTIPEERTQMECLLDMMHQLSSDMREVKARISRIETTLFDSPSPVPVVRGIAAQRGGRITRSKTSSRRRRVVANGSDGSESNAPSQTTTTDFSTDTDREPNDDDGVELDEIDISKTEKRALQRYVTQTFRRVCNVPGRNWPDPNLVRTNAITDEVYPTPIFSAKVTDHRNIHLFHIVAQRALSELQDRDCWPEGLKRPSEMSGPTIDPAFVRECAKESFRACKKQWAEVQKVEAAIMGDANRRNHRRMMRRRRKSEQLSKVILAFCAQHGLDPTFVTDLIHEQFLSDEVSEPDDHSGESKEAWKVRLAAAGNLPLDPNAQQKLQLLEILVPSWRSDAYSDFIHELEQFRLDGDGVSPADVLNLKYDRVGVGRPSDRIPRYSPYDFGVSTQWLKENGNVPANKNILKDWGKWPEPANCGLILERDDDGEIVNVYYTSRTEQEN